MFHDTDVAHMRQALALAAKGLFTTSPNPRVGCVVVRDGEVVGTGWHARAGGPHAETLALQDAGDRARGATAYVTLEPCAHIGRTGPCTEALIKAGISMVVAATEDPNPQVGGRGLERLRSAGLMVRVGLLSDQAQALNRGFFKRMRTGLPWLRIKTASSLDGRTALPTGASKWITDAACRADGHAWRARSCAVLTGMGTFERDRPLLTVRDVHTDRQPLRVVLDGRFVVDPDAPFFSGPGAVVLIGAGPVTPPAADRLARLEARGARVVPLPGVAGDATGRRLDLTAVMRWLAGEGCNEVQLEAGARLTGAFLRDRLVDEWLLYQAPILLGPGHGLAEPMDPVSQPDEAPRWQLDDLSRVGDGLRLLLRPPGAT